MDKTHKFFCVNENENANGVITCDGFVVRKGSLISSVATDDCSEYVVKKRKQCKYLINDSNLLQEDVLSAHLLERQTLYVAQILMEL